MAESHIIACSQVDSLVSNNHELYFNFFLSGGTNKISYLMVVAYSQEICRNLINIKSSASLFNIFKISRQTQKLLWRIPN